jgi:hypothetical protein
VRIQTTYFTEVAWESRAQGASYDIQGEDLVLTHVGFVKRVRVIPIM